jgi:hypothetical protein
MGGRALFVEAGEDEGVSFPIDLSEQRRTGSRAMNPGMAETWEAVEKSR